MADGDMSKALAQSGRSANCSGKYGPFYHICPPAWVAKPITLARCEHRTLAHIRYQTCCALAPLSTTIPPEIVSHAARTQLRSASPPSLAHPQPATTVPA